MNKILRPKTFDDYVGQRDLKENLKVFIEASKQRKQVLDHVLLAGPSGIGKTSFAHILAAELGAKMVHLAGPTLSKPSQLINLSTIAEGTVVFIDEVHAMKPVVQDALLLALEDFKLQAQDPDTKQVMSFELQPFTCIAATTDVGDLHRPLRDRFGISATLDFLNKDDLLKLLKRSAQLLQVPIAEDGMIEVARRSRGTPRVANHILKRVGDYSLVKKKAATPEFIDKVCRRLGIDRFGLNRADRKILKAMGNQFKGGPVGLASLASAADEAASTIATVNEPYMLKRGFLTRSPKGRFLTPKGFKYLEELKNARKKNVPKSSTHSS